MPAAVGYKIYTRKTNLTTSGSNTTVDLEAGANAVVPASHPNGGYSAVALMIRNTGTAAAYLATDALIAAGGGSETEPLTDLVIQPGETAEHGPFQWPGLPKLRLLNGASCSVTSMIRGAY
jgi:hypothetical protein